MDDRDLILRTRGHNYFNDEPFPTVPTAKPNHNTEWSSLQYRYYQTKLKVVANTVLKLTLQYGLAQWCKDSAPSLFQVSLASRHNNAACAALLVLTIIMAPHHGTFSRGMSSGPQ